MSLPKAQLVDPQGNMNLPGMTATGVVTATSLKGVSTGSVTNLTGSPDLDVGIVTGSSFVGDGTGHAANITGTPELNLGVTTATSFVGDAVGKAAGLTGTPNLNVGLITATSFVGFVTGDVTGNISGNVVGNITGDISGLAGALGINGINAWAGAGTSNLGVGVCTATLLYGDGSALVGAGSSAYIAQEVTASGSETIIDLSYGNLIYYQGKIAATTVGFASTSAAEQITFIRSTSQATEDYNISYSTGGVEFDGSDWLSIPDDSDFTFGTDDFTIECWYKTNNTSSLSDSFDYIFASGWPIQLAHNDYKISFWMRDSDNSGSGTYVINNLNTGADSITSTSDWYHIAVTREGSTFRIFLNGALKATQTSSVSAPAPGQASSIGRFSPASPYYYANGTVSNFRYIKGTALYTNDFTPPSAALTNVTNTKLLCCQSDSSTTTAAVIPTGSITTGGDPTAAAETVAASGTITFDNGTITWPDRVKWNGGTAPTLINSSFPSSLQLFRFTTVDTGLNYNAWEEMEEDSNNHTMFGTNKIATRWLNGAVTRYSSPIQLEGNNFKNLFGDSGSENVYALKNDGTMWGAGRNTWGQLGQNTQSSGGFSSPIQIPGTNWKQGSTNGYTVIANKTDGTLWAWGYGGIGNLGDNENANAGNAYAGDLSSPAQIGTGTDWKEPGHGAGDCSQAFKTNGTMWVWGANEHGKLGLNQSSPNALKSSPTQVPGTTWNLGATATSGRNSAAIKTDGTLWIWGTNENGQLGQNTNGTPSGTLDGRSSPAQVGTDTTWANIVWTQYTAYAVKTDASLWQWGQDLYATNDTVHRSSPTQIPGDWSVNLSASRYTASCVKTDGTLWAWGRAYQGIFGQNLDQDGGLFYSSPIQIPGTWSTQKNRLCVSNEVVTVLKEF